MTRGQPLESEYAPDYSGYVAHVSEDEILPVLRSQLDALDVLLGRVTPERETFRYAEGKWSIREIIGHLIDGERVFGYRAYCIARGEKQNLPGFDQDDYMLTAPYDRIDLEDLLSECAWCVCRTSPCCAILTRNRGCGSARPMTIRFPYARWLSLLPGTRVITWECCARDTSGIETDRVVLRWARHMLPDWERGRPRPH